MTIIIIGRSQEADVIVEDNTVSREHLELTFDQNVIFARDMGSSNGSKYKQSDGYMAPLGRVIVEEHTEVHLGSFEVTIREIMDAYGTDNINNTSGSNAAPSKDKAPAKKRPISMYIRGGDGSYKKG